MADHDKEGARQTTGPDSGARGDPGAGGRMADEARHYAEDMAGRAKEQGRSMFEQQKDAAARQMDSVAGAFRNTAGQLQGEGQSQAGRYIGIAAERIESLGRQLREKDVDTLIGDAENLGRRAPGALFAGSVVAGFLLARFLKSSSERRYEAGRSSHEDRTRTPRASAAAPTYPASEADALAAIREPAGDSFTLDTTTTIPAGTSGNGAASASSDGSQPVGGSHGNR